MEQNNNQPPQPNNHFEIEPSTRPTDNPTSTSPPTTAFTPPAQGVMNKEKRTSGIVMYLVAILSGWSILSAASYLAHDVLYNILVKDNDNFSLFDLSSFNLYVLIVLAVLGPLYFAAMQLVSRASNTFPYGFRKRHEIVGAFWQALLILTIVGSVVSLIHAPIDDTLNEPLYGESVGFMGTLSQMLTSVVSILLASSLLWRDRLFAKSRSALLPTIATAIIVITIVISSVALLIVTKENDQDASMHDDYSLNSQTYEADYETYTRKDAVFAETNASDVIKKLEAFNAIESKYPDTISDFNKYPETAVDAEDYELIDFAPLTVHEIQYVKCTASTGAQVIYLNEDRNETILGIGGASSTSSCD